MRGEAVHFPALPAAHGGDADVAEARRRDVLRAAAALAARTRAWRQRVAQVRAEAEGGADAVAEVDEEALCAMVPATDAELADAAGVAQQRCDTYVAQAAAAALLRTQRLEAAAPAPAAEVAVEEEEGRTAAAGGCEGTPPAGTKRGSTDSEEDGEEAGAKRARQASRE